MPRKRKGKDILTYEPERKTATAIIAGLILFLLAVLGLWKLIELMV